MPPLLALTGIAVLPRDEEWRYSTAGAAHSCGCYSTTLLSHPWFLISSSSNPPPRYRRTFDRCGNGRPRPACRIGRPIHATRAINFECRKQISVDHVGMDGRHVVGIALVDLQRGVALSHLGDRAFPRVGAPSFEGGAFLLEKPDHGVHYGAHARQVAQVAVHQQPLVGRDLLQRRTDALQSRFVVAEVAG